MTKRLLMFVLSMTLILPLSASVKAGLLDQTTTSTADTLNMSAPLCLTMQEAVRIALDESASVLVGDLLVEKQRYAHREALAQLFPSVNLTATYGYTIKKQVMYLDGFPGASAMPESMTSQGIEMGRTNNIQAGISVGMPLVSPQLWTSLSISKENTALALQQATTSKVNKVAEVRKAFLQALLAEDAYKVILRSYDNAMRNYHLVENNYKQGLVAQYDVLRSQVQVKNLEPNMLQAQDAVDMARRNLLVLMGVAPETKVTLSGSLSDYESDIMTDYVISEQISLENNPTLRELEHQRNLVNASVQMSKMAFLPTLSVSGMYNYSFASNKFDLDNSRLWTPYSALNFSLSIPLFSGGKRYYNLQQQKVALMQFDLNKRDAQRQLSTAHIEAQNRLRRAARTYGVSAEAIKMAEKGYTIAEKRFETGEGTLLEVNDADLALLQARLNYHQSLFDFMVAKTDLDKLMGLGIPEDKKVENKIIKLKNENKK